MCAGAQVSYGGVSRDGSVHLVIEAVVYGGNLLVYVEDQRDVGFIICLI